MPRASARFTLLTCFSLPLLTLAQQPAAPPQPQTARQAIVEMITGDDQAAFKHLTEEVQQSIKAHGSKAGAPQAATTFLRGLHQGLHSGTEVFDTGPVLLSVSEVKAHEKLEIHVDSDDLTADEDRLTLSLHEFRDGQEIDTPLQFISQIEVGMKRQKSIWRLNDITISAKIPLGDPDLMRKLGVAGLRFPMGGGLAAVSSDSDAVRPKLDAESTLRMLAFAESAYASMHPETGFTCSLSVLVSQNTTMMSGMGVDPAVGSGSLNGYSFTISGCNGTPAGSFQLAAEPVAAVAGAKAFCTDATHNIRISEDGSASTCLASGKLETRGEAVHTVIK
jgi:hypothetical protein